MSKESLVPLDSLVPAQIIERVFKLVNQVRKEYSLNLLIFNKELSFIAAEHACNMSTKSVPYGHQRYHEMEDQVPIAVTFSENIAMVNESKDPGQDIVVAWLKKPKPFSRILANFTHTGIGVAESESGEWYCSQVFVTYKAFLSYKDQLLLMTRFINRMRYENGLNLLSISLEGASNLKLKIKEDKNFMSKLTNKTCATLFYKCKSASFISETLIKGDNNSAKILQMFMNQIQKNEEFNKIISNDKVTDFIYASQETTDNKIICGAIFGFSRQPTKIVPPVHVKFPDAYYCLQFVNEYRIKHNVDPLELSHQWCKAAQKHTNKMIQSEVEIRTLSNVLMRQNPDDSIQCSAYVIPNTNDSIRELFLMWISTPKSKERLLSKAKHFGFADELGDKKFFYATRIIGEKKHKVHQENDVIRGVPGISQSLEISSEEGDSPEEVTDDAILSFRLTG